jgi:methylphosphotriester-DNA--protein-cysteine methyltransferase
LLQQQSRRKRTFTPAGSVPKRVHEIDLEAAPGRWRFYRADPDPDLDGLVTEYWEVEGTLSAFRETLLPNGRVEVMVNLGPPHQLIRDGEASAWEHAWFSGLHERALTIESLHGTHLISARLHPLHAAELLGTPIAALANTVVDLETLLGTAGRELRENVIAAPSPAARFAIFEELLRHRRTERHAPPEFVRRAATRIEETHGNLRVALLHEDLQVSRKHLAVSFTRHLGMSAKAFARIQRFVWTLERLRASTMVDWPQLAHDAGYSDQSHLVRDFRRVGATNPTEYLRRLTPDGTALLYDAG